MVMQWTFEADINEKKGDEKIINKPYGKFNVWHKITITQLKGDILDQTAYLKLHVNGKEVYNKKNEKPVAYTSVKAMFSEEKDIHGHPADIARLRIIEREIGKANVLPKLSQSDSIHVPTDLKP